MTEADAFTEEAETVLANALFAGAQTWRRQGLVATASSVADFVLPLRSAAGSHGARRRLKSPPVGYGSKLNHQGTVGFCLCFHLPGFYFGYLFLTQTLFGSRKYFRDAFVRGRKRRRGWPGAPCFCPPTFILRERAPQEPNEAANVSFAEKLWQALGAFESCHS